MIDFSRAFDTVDHPILLAKPSRLNLLAFALNWIISFLTRRTQVVKINGVVSSPLFINTIIIQGSGVGPSFYIVFIYILFLYIYYYNNLPSHLRQVVHHVTPSPILNSPVSNLSTSLFLNKLKTHLFHSSFPP